MLGRSRQALEEHLTEFAEPAPKHSVVGHATAGAFEFVIGHRVTDGQVVGTFIAAASTSSTGKLSRYLGSYFEGTLAAPEADAQ